MKSLINFFAVLFLLLLFTESKAAPAGQNPNVSFSFFYDRLYSLGQWIELDDELVVWRPSGVSSSWSPYSNGNWIWTRYGWYWDSYESYGDIVYHYGRWFNDEYYGWIWVPDYDWAPAWVQWRYDDDYIGWTPLPPYAKFGVLAGITFTNTYSIHYSHWNFVPFRRFCDPYVAHYFVRERVKYRVFDRTREHVNFRYEDNVAANRGLDREIIEQRSRTTVTQRDVIFRDAATMKDRGSRSIGNTIEIGVPKNETRVRGTSELNIKRGERSSTLNASKVEIGERNRIQIEKTDNRKTGNAGTGTDTRFKGQTQTNERDNERVIKNPSQPVRIEKVERKAEKPAIEQRVKAQAAPPARQEQRQERAARPAARGAEKAAPSPERERKSDNERTR